MVITAGPLVAAFKELEKDEPDPDHVSVTIQQALPSLVMQMLTLAKFIIQNF